VTTRVSGNIDRDSRIDPLSHILF